MFASRLRNGVFSVIFSFEIEFYAVGNQGIRLYSQNVNQNQLVLLSSIYMEPVLSSCEECNAFEDLLFFRSYFCLLGRFLSLTSVFFCSSIYIEVSPKLPLQMQRICGPFVFKTVIINHFAFRETLA